MIYALALSVTELEINAGEFASIRHLSAPQSFRPRDDR